MAAVTITRTSRELLTGSREPRRSGESPRRLGHGPRGAAASIPGDRPDGGARSAGSSLRLHSRAPGAGESDLDHRLAPILAAGLFAVIALAVACSWAVFRSGVG